MDGRRRAPTAHRPPSTSCTSPSGSLPERARALDRLLCCSAFACAALPLQISRVRLRRVEQSGRRLVTAEAAGEGHGGGLRLRGCVHASLSHACRLRAGRSAPNSFACCRRGGYDACDWIDLDRGCFISYSSWSSWIRLLMASRKSRRSFCECVANANTNETNITQTLKPRARAAASRSQHETREDCRADCYRIGAGLRTGARSSVVGTSSSGIPRIPAALCSWGIVRSSMILSRLRPTSFSERIGCSPSASVLRHRDCTSTRVRGPATQRTGFRGLCTNNGGSELERPAAAGTETAGGRRVGRR